MDVVFLKVFFYLKIYYNNIFYFLKIIFDFRILKYIKTLKIFLKHKNK